MKPTSVWMWKAELYYNIIHVYTLGSAWLNHLLLSIGPSSLTRPRHELP